MATNPRRYRWSLERQSRWIGKTPASRGTAPRQASLCLCGWKPHARIRRSQARRRSRNGTIHRSALPRSPKNFPGLVCHHLSIHGIAPLQTENHAQNVFFRALSSKTKCSHGRYQHRHQGWRRHWRSGMETRLGDGLRAPRPQTARWGKAQGNSLRER